MPEKAPSKTQSTIRNARVMIAVVGVLFSPLPVLQGSTLEASAELCAGYSGFAGALRANCAEGTLVGSKSFGGYSGEGRGINSPFSMNGAGDTFEGYAVAFQDYGVFHGATHVLAQVLDPIHTLGNGGFSAVAGGSVTENWFIPGPVGQSGRVKPQFTVSGGTASSASTWPGVVVDSELYIVASVSGVFAGGSGTIHQAGTYELSDGGLGLLFPFNTPFSVTISTVVGSGASWDPNNPPPSFGQESTASFLDTSILTGATFTDAFGRPLSGDFAINGEQGRIYPLASGPASSDGSSVPEPSALWPISAGLLLLVRNRLRSKSS
jgi:hypothetical protein